MKFKCRRCHGSGLEPDGWELRARRVRRGITLRDMAGRLGISESQLSRLELGSRYWRPGQESAFVAECRKGPA